MRAFHGAIVSSRCEAARPRPAHVVALLVLLALSSGCQSSRANPTYRAPSRDIKTVTLVQPDVKVYRLHLDDTRELVDEWSEQVRKNIVRSVSKLVEKRGRFVLSGPGEIRPGAEQQEYADVRPLFEVVAVSALTYAVNLRDPAADPLFPVKRQLFDYSLGPLPALANAAGTDALLFVYAFDYVSSGERKAAVAFRALIAPMQPGHSMMAAALVDPRTGDLLWFSARRRPAKGIFSFSDLRVAGDAESMVADVFEDLAAPARK